MQCASTHGGDGSSHDRSRTVSRVLRLFSGRMPLRGNHGSAVLAHSETKRPRNNRGARKGRYLHETARHYAVRPFRLSPRLTMRPTAIHSRLTLGLVLVSSLFVACDAPTSAPDLG